MSKQINEAKDYFHGGYYEKLLLVEDKNLENNEETRVKTLNTMFDQIKKLIEEKGGGITTSQIRNIFGRVKNAKELSDLVLLRPKLAYISARQGNNRNARMITDFIGDLIKRVNKPVHKKSLQTVMEAMVAYHKLYHQKKS
ncbi:MAG: type III-A CRISPR-associated protein Csm2 [Bacteroidetes bacterium]|nr:type III-A CRISPR-associated protein Csm2 [Bacteroidota bacterium]